MQMERTRERIEVAVIGASGTTGGELIRLLSGHPDVTVSFLGARDSAGTTLAEVHPHLASSPAADEVLEPVDVAAIAARADAAFLALPHGASGELAPALVGAGVRIVDLGGDFRLAADAYPRWYGFTHPAPEWLAKAVYGLPELFGEQIGGAELVANPGCYPTPVILGLSPLIAAGLVDAAVIRVDGKTGLSGAGKTPSDSTSFLATEESVRPYRVSMHQHTPEMERGIELATGRAPSVLFVPHLVPTVRGVLITAYAGLEEGVTTDRLTECLVAAYPDAPFVRVLPAGSMADTKRTRGTNMVELQALADPRTGTAVIVGAVDNLVKAIQNFNLAQGLPETTGLPTLAVYP
jgi:N-acetyl-gamma-glutamyl-phosphate reductase